MADVIAVLDALGIGRAALVGNSRGGRIPFDTALEFPGRIVAVVGVAAGLGGFEVEPRADEIPILEAYDRVDSAEPFDADALTDFETQVWLDGPLQQPHRVHWTLREMFRMMARPLNEPGRVRGREIRLEPPANERLDELGAPVLAIAGSLDFSDVVHAAHRLAAAAPHAPAIVLDAVAVAVTVTIALVFAMASPSVPLAGGTTEASADPSGGSPPVAAPASGQPTARPLPKHELFGFVPYWEMNGDIAKHLERTPLTTLALFSVTTTKTGKINTSQLGYKRITGSIGDQLIRHAHDL